jgi:transcriptional antiterminator NusG
MQCRLTSASQQVAVIASRRLVAPTLQAMADATRGTRQTGTKNGYSTEGGEALAVSGAAMGNQAWYAVWTNSHCEQLVSQQLSARGFSAFLPEMSVWSKRGGEQRLIRVPMFPGYLFVHDAMDKRSYVEILKARGVVRILEDGWSRLTPIPDQEIDAIQQVVRADVPVFLQEHLAYGDRVEVTEGPLSGLEGLFVQDKPTKGRLVLNVNLLGRSVAVEVDATAVRSCKSPR